MTDHPDIRIGDRDRLGVQDRLRDAYGQGAIDTDELEERLELTLRARTQSDLVPLVADLPPPIGDTAVEPMPPPPVPAPDREDADLDDDDDEDDSRWGWLTMVSLAVILAIAVSTGVMEPPVIFGGRNIQVGPDSEDVRVLVLFGGVDVQVEADTTVDESVMAIFGGASCEGSVCSTSDPDVTVTGLVLFGGVDITPLQGQ